MFISWGLGNRTVIWSRNTGLVRFSGFGMELFYVCKVCSKFFVAFYALVSFRPKSMHFLPSTAVYTDSTDNTFSLKDINGGWIATIGNI